MKINCHPLSINFEDLLEVSTYMQLLVLETKLETSMSLAFWTSFSNRIRLSSSSVAAACKGGDS